MRSQAFGLVVTAVAGLVAGVALVSCGGDEGASTTTDTTATQPAATQPTTLPPVKVEETIVLVRVVNGLPVGGIARATVDRGERVEISVTADVADEVHLHGYDLTADVADDRPAHIDFTANVPGRFEVELEERGVQIAELTVQP